jgi:hypothetical protein
LPEFDSWLGRARYERRPGGPPGKRNGFRPRHVQTAEGELEIEVPQVREVARPYVSKLFPKWHCKPLLRTHATRRARRAALTVGRAPALGGDCLLLWPEVEPDDCARVRSGLAMEDQRDERVAEEWVLVVELLHEVVGVALVCGR